MAMNRVQFQRGLSMPAFLGQYGSEAQCEAMLISAWWPQGFVCPGCASKTHCAFNVRQRRTFECLDCGQQTEARGNITERGTNGYYFDMGNRLQASVYVEHYSYDGLGRRTVTYRDDGSVIFQMYSQAGQLLFGQRQTGTGTVNTRYVYLDGKLIAEDSNSGRTFVHSDALGSPVAMTDGSTGAIVARTRYEPYGATAAGTNPDGPGFTGHVHDPGTGLIYMQQRYYDPIAGRFQSLDPVATDANTGVAFNRYLYSNGNP